MIEKAIEKIIQLEDLNYSTVEAVMDEIMCGKASPVQISAYLTAMAMKGESIDEISASAAGMRKHCISIHPKTDVLEIVGTGGDQSNSFNISTTASLVVSAAGVPVAKHGNRAASSKCGAADVLEALGVNISISASHSQKILEQIGLCFLFAQNYHTAMKYVAPVRKELGIRTIFNLLGPLANPAKATIQLLGVYKEDLVEPLARVLSNLGVKQAMVVYGQDGLDGISMSAPTSVFEIRNGKSRSYVMKPEQYGFHRCDKRKLVGGSPEDNAKITREILSGKKSPQRDTVLLNAGAALYLANPELTLEQGISLAEITIDSGKALQRLEQLIALSNEVIS